MSNLTRSREGAMDEEVIASVIVGAAFDIHTELGPGLLESVYDVVLAELLRERGMAVERQVDVPIHFRGRTFPVGFRADLIVEQKVCVELKSVEVFAPIHAKQLLTYLRLLDYRLGLLINFGAPLLKDGVKRVANRLNSTKYPPRAFAASRETPSSNE
jgi:iron complex transport system substrate-binding protein